MIRRISIQRFKSLWNADLSLGPLNIIVGANASGKSNFFDALRVLQGIGYGFSLSEIFNGKPKSAGGQEWEAIRGGAREVTSKPAGPRRFGAGLTVEIDEPRLEYSIEFNRDGDRVRHERLSGVFDSERVQLQGKHSLFVEYSKGGRGRPPHLEFERSRPVVQQLVNDQRVAFGHRKLARGILDVFANMQWLDLSPQVLRDYSGPQQAGRLGDRGENFAALVSRILSDPADKRAYEAWLRRITPAEMEKIKILRGALEEPLFGAELDGWVYSAPTLSDGFLRFAAMTAALFQPDTPDVLMIEEVENGLHPTRLRLLVDLLKSRAAAPRPQIIVTTHSPVLLSWLEPADYKTAFLFRRDTDGNSEVTPLSEVPRLAEIVRKQPLAELFSEGWLETAP